MRYVTFAAIVATGFLLGACQHIVSYSPTESAAHWSVQYEGAELNR